MKIITESRLHSFYLLLAFLYGFALQAAGQTVGQPDLIPYRKGNLWGYADLNRKIVIKPAYDEAYFFEGPRAIVRKENKYGLINKRGEVVVPPTYSKLVQFENGFTFFENKNQAGLLDSLGKEVITFSPKSDLTQFRQKGISLFYYPDQQTRDYRYFYVNEAGNRLPTPELLEASEFTNGRAIVKAKNKTGFLRTTLIDKTGKDLLPEKYVFIKEGRINNQTVYVVSTIPGIKSVEEDGEINYDRSRRFGLLDSAFKEIIPFKFRRINVEENFITVTDGFNKTGFWNFNTQKKLTRRRFDKIEYSINPGRALVTAISKQGLMDSAGNFIIPLAKRPLLQENHYAESFNKFRSLGLKTPTFFYKLEHGQKTAFDPYGKTLPGFQYGYLENLNDSLYLACKSMITTKDDLFLFGQIGGSLVRLLDRNGNSLTDSIYKICVNRKYNNQVVLANDTLLTYFTAGGTLLANRRKTKQTISYIQKPVTAEPNISEVPRELLAPENLTSCFYLLQKLPGGYNLIANTCLYNQTAFGLTGPGGKVVLPFHYNEIYPLSGELLAAKLAGYWGVVNLNGETVLPFNITKITKLENGAFIAQVNPLNHQGHYAIFDSTAKKLSNDPFYQINNSLKPDSILLFNTKGMVTVNKSGIIVKETAGLAHNTQFVKPGIIHSGKISAWGFIDASGKKIIDYQFNQAKPFSEGLAAVENNGLWGYIDKTGKIIIPLIYHDAQPFSEGKAVVKTEAGFQFISKSGKAAFPGTYKEAHSFSEGLAAVKIAAKWGYINEKGKVVFPFKYDQASSFKNSIAIIRLGYSESYLTKKGDLLLKPRLQKLYAFENNFGWIERGKMWYKVNLKGRIVDSTAVYPIKPIYPEQPFQLKEGRLFKTSADETQPLNGRYEDILRFSEGLIGVKKYLGIWYYQDLNGNAFYEKGEE